jgi:sugar phosphate permease
LVKKRRFPKIYFGWWTVLATGVLALWGHGYHAYGFSALFKPISTELGFSRTTTSIAASIGRLEGGFEAPLTGWLTDRFGPRWIVLFGIFLIGLSLILMNYIDSLWAFYLVWGLCLGTGINIALSLPTDKALTNWFVKKRGVALGIKNVMSGFSGVLVLPLIALLIVHSGWRETCFIGGVVMLVIGIPLTWFFLKQQRPEYYGLLPDGATVEEEVTDTNRMIDRGIAYATEVEEVEYTLRQAMRTPTYWLLMVANACHSLAMPAVNIHGIPFLTDIGIDPIRAASMLAMMILASVPMRFIAGVLADRVSKNSLRFLMGGAYLLQAAGFGIFLLHQTEAMIYVWFILYGIGMGGGFGLMAPMRARYFGRKAFGSIAGSSRLFMAPIGIAAPIYLGWVYDTTGSYISAFTILAGLVALAGFVAVFILPPKPPAKVTELRNII